MPSATVLHLARAVCDASGVAAAPGAVAVRDATIVASGTPAEVRRALAAAPDATIDHGDVLIVPAFVNAHAHLDLAAVGPRPYGGDFIAWIDVVIRERARGGVTAAVEHGLAASHAQGVGWIGDIAASDEAVDARAGAATFVPGVAWLEAFGLGRREHDGAAAATRRVTALRTRHAHVDGLRIDLEPHAPYSAGDAVFDAAIRLGAPTTHLAETLDEQRFVASANGPFRDLLQRVGAWDDSIGPRGSSPVRALAPLLARAPWVLAHCNYVDDDDLAILARCRDVSVAYCPIASEYFGHRDHRYRDMLARGIRVCLGTDSVICQPATEPAPHGILAQCRRLFERDAMDPTTLLAMATTHGAAALGLPRGTATLRPGAPARIAAIALPTADGTDPWHGVLRADTAMRSILPAG